jgi:hypothetical protein
MTFNCLWRKSAYDKNKRIKQPESCRMLACSGEFEKMPALYDNIVLSCFIDEKSGKSSPVPEGMKAMNSADLARRVR